MKHWPESIVHKIMSFLPFVEAVRFCVLSWRFNSFWRSFPILELFFDGQHHRNLGVFFHFIYNNLLDRPTNVVHKLSIHAYFNSMFNPRGPDLLFLAASFNLRELELRNTDTQRRDNHKDGRYYSLVLPGSIFHLKSLTVLKLDRFRFDTSDIVLDGFSGLKKLQLARALGIQTLVFKKNKSLESLEIDHCEELISVVLDAPNLEYFSFLGPFSIRKCEVVISPSTKGLKTLILKHATVSKAFFQETTPTSQVVEDLIFQMSKTMDVKRIQLDWTNLKKVEFMGMIQLQKIDLLSEKLESCVLNMAWSPTCEVNFVNESGKLLTSLSLLFSEKITGAWIEQILPRFRFLESFRVEGCAKVKWIKVHHDRIKHLKLLCCNALDRLDIDCPMLESIEISCNDRVPSHVVIRSGPLNVKLSLHFRRTKAVPHEDLNKFLMIFNYCQELTLDFNSSVDNMFPPRLRADETLITPLYDVKNLKIDLTIDKEPDHVFSNLLKCLFWLVPLPECITFITSLKDLSIKFEYADFEDEEAHPSCPYCPLKCWRHRMVSVRLRNFDNQCAKTIAKKRALVDFLRGNAMMLTAIHDDCESSDSQASTSKSQYSLPSTSTSD